jgi:hypothetical protein
MSAVSAIGPMVAASDVEAALLDQLVLWLPDYLAESDRLAGDAVGTMPKPKSYVISADVEKMPEDQTPAVIVASPGLVDPPVADGLGAYTARWDVAVAIVLSARGNNVALVRARRYAAAMRALCVQQQLLVGVDVRRVDWADQRYDVLDSIDDRTIAAARVGLVVEVADVTVRDHGPTEPVLPPGNLGPDSPAWPEATTADVAVEKEGDA